MQSNPESSLMNVRQAAQFLSISVSTLYGWVWQRRISFVKVGRALRFEKVDLEKFVRMHKFEARRQLYSDHQTILSTMRGAAGKG
jgi:excisionase family DNA binding protein